MKSNEHKPKSLEAWDLGVKILGIIGVVVTIYMTSKDQTKVINNEWGREFYQQKMSMYLQTSDIVSQIGFLSSKENLDSIEKIQLQKLIGQFKILYGGPMAILEKCEVERAMVYFNLCLLFEGNFERKKIKNLSFYLSHVMKNEANKYFLEGEGELSVYGTNCELLCRMRTILMDENIFTENGISQSLMKNDLMKIESEYLGLLNKRDTNSCCGKCD